MQDIKDYFDLRKLVDDFGGIEEFRFFGILDKYTLMTPFGFALAETCDDFVECKIDESGDLHGGLYSLAHGYKVKVSPVNDNRYASRLFYQSDLLQNFQSGVFIIKEGSGHIEHKAGIEHLCGNAYLFHAWSEIVQ